MEFVNPGVMRFRCMSRQGGSSAILQKAFFKHALVNSNNNRLLFTPFTVTRFAIQVEIHPHKCYIMFNMMSVVKNAGALIDKGNGKIAEAFCEM